MTTLGRTWTPGLQREDEPVRRSTEPAVGQLPPLPRLLSGRLAGEEARQFLSKNRAPDPSMVSSAEQDYRLLPHRKNAARFAYAGGYLRHLIEDDNEADNHLHFATADSLKDGFAPASF